MDKWWEPKFLLDALLALGAAVLASLAWLRRPGERASESVSALRADLQALRSERTSDTAAAMRASEAIADLRADLQTLHAQSGTLMDGLRLEITRLLERQAAQESVIVKMQQQQDKRIERLEDFFMQNFRKD